MCSNISYSLVFIILSFNSHVFIIAGLEITPNDPKALFRRCQAYEKLGKVQEAFKDAAVLMKVDPKNNAVHAIFKKLNPIMQGKVCTEKQGVSYKE